jgi:hypothetical protein
MDPRKPIGVFLSSTCYDLVDFRAELAAYPQANGFRTVLSDDPRSAFYIDPADDSIASCLNNVEAADVVVCVIDRRYDRTLVPSLCRW